MTAKMDAAEALGLATGLVSSWRTGDSRAVVATLAKLLEEKGSGRGLISICTAGGMGVTAILER